MAVEVIDAGTHRREVNDQKKRGSPEWRTQAMQGIHARRAFPENLMRTSGESHCLQCLPNIELHPTLIMRARITELLQFVT
jgi:hypothetical protein